MAPIPQANSNAVALFTVPETIWTPISKRVGLTVLAGGEVSNIVKELPQLPNLITACQAWTGTTVPGMVSLSTDIASFATAAAVSLSQLNYSISQEAQGATVSKTGADLVTSAFAALAQQAAPLIAQCNALEAQIQAFGAENQTADSNYQMFYWMIGPNWPVLGNSIPTVGQATSEAMAAWQAISDDFNAVTAGSIQSMRPSLLSSELQQAIQSWMTIAGAASAFTLATLGQQQYLSGAWTS